MVIIIPLLVQFPFWLFLNDVEIVILVVTYVVKLPLKDAGTKMGDALVGEEICEETGDTRTETGKSQMDG